MLLLFGAVGVALVVVTNMLDACDGGGADEDTIAETDIDDGVDVSVGVMVT